MTKYNHRRSNFAAPEEPTLFITVTATCEVRPFIPSGCRTVKASNPSSKGEIYKSGAVFTSLVLRRRDWNGRNVTVPPQSYILIEPIFDRTTRPKGYSVTVIPPQDETRYLNFHRKTSDWNSEE